MQILAQHAASDNPRQRTVITGSANDPRQGADAYADERSAIDVILSGHAAAKYLSPRFSQERLDAFA